MTIPYFDANNEPLDADSLAVEISDLGFGRISRFQYAGDVLMRLANHRAPMPMRPGRNAQLRKIVLPDFVNRDIFNEWYPKFVQLGLWIWIEHPTDAPEEVLLVAVWDKDHLYKRRLSDSLDEASSRTGDQLLEWWLYQCWRSLEEELMYSKPEQQNRMWR